MSKNRNKGAWRKKVSYKELNQKRRRAEKLEKIAFFNSINEMSSVIGIHEPIQNRLGAYETRFMFYSRFRKPNVKSVSAFLNLPTKAKKLIQSVMDDFLQTNYFTLPHSNKKFSYLEYFTCFLSLRNSIKYGESENVECYHSLSDDYKPFMDFTQSDKSPETHFSQFLVALGNYLSYPTKYDVCLTQNTKVVKGKITHLASTIEVDIRHAEGKRILFQDQLKTVFPLSIQAKKRIDISMPASLFYPKSAIKQAELKVYFQKHAIDRIIERVDCMDETHIFESLLSSFMKPESTKISNSKFLISYYVDGVKLGYFVIVVVDGVAIVKTFLFLTNDGTPEGNRLKTNLKMSKHEKKYFSLDKLSSFYYSDIDQDELVRNVLKQSGCHQLLEIKKKINTYQAGHQTLISKSLPTINSLRHYIQLGNVA